MSEWISVDDRLPGIGVTVLVYSPPTEQSWPGEININFDYIEEGYEDWFYHCENYEHFYAAGMPDIDGVSVIGPSEKAPYTHWMPLPEPPE